MNQHQRKFLLEAIEKQYSTEIEALRAREPKEPSLNNYLTAAILDGSFKMRDPEEVAKRVRQRVRDLGKGEALVIHGDDVWGRRSSEEQVAFVKLPALLLFEVPPEYEKVKAEYDAAMEKWEAEMADLKSSIAAMRIKVQIGSDAALTVLIDQADKLCSMSLTASSRLLLGNAS